MDGDVVLGAVYAVAVLGLFIAIPVSTLRRPDRRAALIARMRKNPGNFWCGALLSAIPWLAAVIFLGWILMGTAFGGTRSAAERLAFQRENPCPATGLRRGSCPGYVIDHVTALACGGADHRTNMQWQTVADARAKDRWERRGCQRR